MTAVPPQSLVGRRYQKLRWTTGPPSGQDRAGAAVPLAVLAELIRNGGRHLVSNSSEILITGVNLFKDKKDQYLI
jgi:hypothetical protein